MDNISGSANWTVYDVPVEKEKVIEEVKEKVPYIKPNLTSLESLINELENKYKSTPITDVGNALVHLNISKKLLQ